jgi:hypothetical protein
MIFRSTKGYHAAMPSRSVRAFPCRGLDTAFTIKRVDIERRAETNSLGRTSDGATGTLFFGCVDLSDILDT